MIGCLTTEITVEEDHMRYRGHLARPCVLLAVSLGLLFTIVGCKHVDKDNAMSFSDDELENLRISILWRGDTDRSAPEVVFIVGNQASTNWSTTHFGPTVTISREEARRILDVLVPIYQKKVELRDDSGYVGDIRTLQRHLEFPLGPNGKSQAAALTAIYEKVGTEGRPALASMIAYVSN